MTLSESEINSILDHFRKELQQALLTKDAPMARRLRRRLDRFEAFCRCGFNPDGLLRIVDLPADYSGKILLVLVSGGLFDGKICLRSNDLCHRDILRNTQLEIQDLGLPSTQVHELGGAHLANESADKIRIWGSSEDFGACDKEFAARLVASLLPEKRVIVEG